MRRPLTLAALALMLFGVEVVTGAVPLAAVRLWTGFGARVGGEESVISGLCAPPCLTATKRVRHRKQHKILSRILETNVTRRHCERCGWNGLAA